MIHRVGKLVLFFYRKLLHLLYPKMFKEFKGDYRQELKRLEDFSQEDFSKLDLGNRNEVFKKWESYIKQNFSADKPEEFYLNWKGEIGYLAIATNIHDQFRRFELYLKLKKYTQNMESLIDIGCGSAAIYWSMLASKESYLIDVENENQKYISHKVKPRLNIINGDISKIPSGYQADIVCIIDVLEHLEHPSKFFIENVHPYLKLGGLLFVQAPWGGIPEHLPEAPLDWGKSGRSFLTEKYEFVSPINHIFHLTNYYLSGVYRKKVE